MLSAPAALAFFYLMIAILYLKSYVRTRLLAKRLFDGAVDEDKLISALPLGNIRLQFVTIRRSSNNDPFCTLLSCRALFTETL
jgi:hypothetical protein